MPDEVLEPSFQDFPWHPEASVGREGRLVRVLSIPRYGNVNQRGPEVSVTHWSPGRHAGDHGGGGGGGQGCLELRHLFLSPYQTFGTESCVTL